MWRYRNISIRSTSNIHHQLYQSLRRKHEQSSSALTQGYTTEHASSETTAAHWFLHRSTLSTLPHKSTGPVIRELKSFDEFGLLSRNGFTSVPHTTGERAFVDHFLSHDISPVVDLSAIPTTVDSSELGGSVESVELEQLEELLDQGYDVSAVLNSMTADESSSIVPTTSSAVMESMDRKGDCASLKGTRQVLSETQRRSFRNSSSVVPSVTPSVHEPLQSRSDSSPRFDPDIYRATRATASEIIEAVENQDLSSLRSILMEKQWPDYRSIGRHLDKLFELVINGCRDTDEAMLFLRDFAASNRGAFLHDDNAIRLAYRITCDSGSIDAAVESLKVFRNMFLVRPPMSRSSAVKCLMLYQLYAVSSSVGTLKDAERLHCALVDGGFDENGDIFISALTRMMLKKWDIAQVFEEWRRLSVSYGTTCASELIWERLLGLADHPKKQATLAGKLLSHCLQYEHPSATVANLVTTLVRTRHLNSARLVSLKISVPGKFFKKALQSSAYYEHTLQEVEDFASLVSDCIFAEKKRTKKPSVLQSSVLMPDLLLVLDSFCGVTKRKQSKFVAKNDKKKIHRVNDVQLYELSEFLQNLWLKEAEKSCDPRAVDRMVAWSIFHKLDITPKMAKQIADIKSRTQPPKS
ncbi:unnamed protein product [Cylicocyclus nassatus]|uniref:Uncharacterized protein n=1 Tax=Cylicocyclus nassatus TaxID=53992 RepID=A0AA36GDM7_CYLNA|nr:unnamed protein product [Cylicocyclus nassatus]